MTKLKIYMITILFITTNLPTMMMIFRFGSIG